MILGGCFQHRSRSTLSYTLAIGSTRKGTGGVVVHAHRASDVERTVEIPRRVAEEMLVKHYREVLEGLPDGEVARLFEEEIVSEGFQEKKVDGGGMRDFPVDVVLGQNVLEEGEQEEEQEVQGRVEKGDETSALLSQQSEGRAAVVHEYWDAGGFLSVDPKDVALPVMGVGVVVIGVALMYKLISTLSSSGNGSVPVDEKVVESRDVSPAVEKGENGLNDAPPSPPVGILWQRKEISPPRGVDSITNNETNDLWRVPMNDLRRSDGGEEYTASSLDDEHVSSGRDVQESRRDNSENIYNTIESKRGMEKTKILDNAESIAVPHPHSQLRVQRMQTRRPSS
jgi:hypothetical protein